MKFLDQAKIYIKSGNGGPGSISFRREANVPQGGPDGGNGGNGGNILVKCVNNLNTLIDFRYQQHFKAQSGRPGAGRNMTGANGKNIELKLPIGTQIFSEDKKTLYADLTKEGETKTILYGGLGGKGNSFFKSSTNRAPRKFQSGEKGSELWVWLRLKLIADVGIIGLPNSGKSTFLSKISSAKPKIADYPFTTLFPNLGVCNFKNVEIILADIPGLIEKAHIGSGLGHRFLGHVERCNILLHLIDCKSKNPLKDWKIIREELRLYDKTLTNKQEIIILSKSDTMEEKDIKKLRNDFKSFCESEILVLSSITNRGIDNILNKILLNFKKSI